MVWAIKTLWIQHNKGRKFPIIIIITLFINKSSRDTSNSKVTAMHCFISILSHTTDVLKTSASYFPCFVFNLCCHSFHCNRSFLDTKLYSCPSPKKNQNRGCANPSQFPSIWLHFIITASSAWDDIWWHYYTTFNPEN